MGVCARIVMLVTMLGWALPAIAQSPRRRQLPPLLLPRPRAPSDATPPAAPPTPPAPDAAHEDPFGLEVTMPEKTIVFFRGNGNWDSAFETIVDAFKTVNAFIAKQGRRPNGSAMTIYTATDDTSFSFQAAVPVVELPKEAPARRHRRRQIAGRQRLEIRPSRVVRLDGYHLRSDHQSSR